MHSLRHNMKGGADYKIEDILGGKFQKFVNLLDNSGYDGFTYNEYAASEITGKIQGKDIHPAFTEYLITVADAFREIENPTSERYEVSSKYAKDIEDFFSQLMTGKITGVYVPPTRDFVFEQLPYFPGLKDKYLVSGFHLLKYNPNIYPSYETGKQSNQLINVIKYLYHYIALLDTTNLDSKDLIESLMKDNIYFMKYVRDLYFLMFSESFEKNPEIPDDAIVIKNGIIKGLSAIAFQIITELKSSNNNLSRP